ncbi:hypothetical protein SeLEV6574_g07475, partial [Synchytrium endobioticum]
LVQILDNDARERLARISIVKAEKARAVEDLLIRMAQTGQLRAKVNQQQLIDMLEQINTSSHKDTKVTIARRRDNLQLAVAVGPIKREDIDAYTDRVGGLPVWLNDTPPPSTASSACGNCGDPLFLIAQIQTPSTKYGRVLYVFGCNHQHCSKAPGSWRLLRGHHYYQNPSVTAEEHVPVQPPAKDKAAPPTWANTLFPVVNDWSETETTRSVSHISCQDIKNMMTSKEIWIVQDTSTKTVLEANSNVTAVNRNALEKEVSPTIQNVSNPEPIESEPEDTKLDAQGGWSNIPFFQPHALQFYIPSSRHNEDYSYEYDLLSEYQKSDPKSYIITKVDSEFAPEPYEKEYGKGIDKSLHRFLKTVSNQDPEQCIRYQHRGIPLLFGEDDVSRKIRNKEIPSKCGHCGSVRVFECQLMPALLSLLPTENVAISNRADTRGKGDVTSAADFKTWLTNNSQGMDFGTVLMYTCASDCAARNAKKNDVFYFEEFAVAQVESLFTTSV